MKLDLVFTDTTPARLPVWSISAYALYLFGGVS